MQLHSASGGVGTSDHLMLEVFLGGNWIKLPVGELHTISDLAEWSEILLRVRPQLGAPSGHLRYVLVAGSTPVGIDDLTSDGDRSPKVPPSHSPWARVQNEDTFNWSANITDTTGNPVRGLYMAFEAKNNDPLVNTVTFDYGVDTDYQGVVTSSDTVRDCDGYMEHSYLNVRYNFGTYKIYAPFFDQFGLVTHNDTFLQICDDY